MSSRIKGGDSKLVIWDDATDTLPFDDPLAHADRVKFSTTFGYSRIIDKRTVNCTFPAINRGAERSGTIQLFAHGRGGVPRVRGNITLQGSKVSMGCHVPIQLFIWPNPYEARVRLAVLGATDTHVVVCWHSDLRGSGSGQLFDATTIPITVEVFDELN